MNRNFPSAVAYGPLEFGGMDLPELLTGSNGGYLNNGGSSNVG